MKVILSENKHHAVTAAAEKIAEYIAIETWLFVSGGSSFGVFKKLDTLLTQNQKQLIRLLLVDERYGKEGHADSNWKLMKEIDMSDYAGSYPILDDTLSKGECTQEYNEILEMVFESDAQTVAILGIGSDSHIAGIKPMEQKLFNSNFLDPLVAGYAGQDYERITLTPRALVQIGLRVCFVSGADKLPVIASLAIDKPLNESPVHILKDTDNTVIYNVT